MAEWKDARRVELLHRLRGDARLRVARAKQRQRVQTYDDLIDRVADAIDGPGAEALTGKLRAQYTVALVDELPDTDARQWRILDHWFGVSSGGPPRSVRRTTVGWGKGWVCGVKLGG